MKEENQDKISDATISSKGVSDLNVTKKYRGKNDSLLVSGVVLIVFSIIAFTVSKNSNFPTPTYKEYKTIRVKNGVDVVETHNSDGSVSTYQNGEESRSNPPIPMDKMLAYLSYIVFAGGVIVAIIGWSSIIKNKNEFQAELIDSVKSKGSISDELIKLKSLLDQGIINQEQFEKQRSKLLS